MSTQLPDIDKDFEAAAEEAVTPQDRAYTLIGVFLGNTMENYFNVDSLDIALEQDEETGEFQLGLELLPEHTEQDLINFGKMKFTLIETLETIQNEIESGRYPFIDIAINQYALEGFTTHMPALKDFVALLTRVSDLRDLHWDNPKICVDTGYDVSLADLRQAIALIPEKPQSSFDEEQEVRPYDRPVDMGLPKVWLH